MLDKVIRKFWRSERGTAIVETAIVIPLAILIFAGGFELARGLSHHHAADKAVRNAARYLARIPGASAPTNAFAKQIVTADNAELTDADVTVDAGRFAIGFVSLKATVTYKVTLLSAVLPNPEFKFTVAHEQPYVGD